MPKIALVKGPNLRDDGHVRIWESLHRQSRYDVVAFASHPERFDTDQIEVPVRHLSWPEGKFEVFGYKHFFSRALRKAKLPSDFLYGISELSEEFDIIHSNENFKGFSLQCALATSRSDCSFVFSADENIPYPLFQQSPFLKQVKRYVNSKADAITSVSPATKRALIHEGVNPEKIEIIPNSVDMSAFYTREPETFAPRFNLDIGEDTTTILFVHKLCEQKGTPHLIKAFERLNSQLGNTHLVLVGENKLSERQTDRIKENGSISWLGRVPHREMPYLYNTCDIFALPSVTMPNNEEQFGMGLVEAMACGLSSVTTEVGGLPYVTNYGETSLLVEERSADQLHVALRKLVTDENLRLELGDRARQRAKNTFESGVVATKLEALYDELLKTGA